MFIPTEPYQHDRPYYSYKEKPQKKMEYKIHSTQASIPAHLQSKVSKKL